MMHHHHGCMHSMAHLPDLSNRTVIAFHLLEFANSEN